MRESAVRIALVYPSLLGTYGDGGNASVLAQRLRWRGVDAAVVDVAIDAAIPREVDLLVLGGGEDTAQTLAVARLTADGGLHRAADAGTPVFAVCAGFQILGETFLEGTGAERAGLGLVDCRTVRLEGPRAVGELLAEPLLPGVTTLTGYENHGGRTLLGPAAAPLAKVVAGVGNGDGTEGAVQGSVLCTYAHGPALARNPGLADHLLRQVVGGELAPLDDGEEEALRAERMAFVRRQRRSARRQWRPPARG